MTIGTMRGSLDKRHQHHSIQMDSDKRHLHHSIRMVSATLDRHLPRIRDLHTIQWTSATHDALALTKKLAIVSDATNQDIGLVNALTQTPALRAISVAAVTQGDNTELMR